MKNLEDQKRKAIELVDHYFNGKTDKGGVDYKHHLYTVAESIKRIYDPSFCQKMYIVALLHDILEDTDCTVSELSKYFDEDIVKSVISITKLREESYPDYIGRLKKDEMAKIVKLCDLCDNMNITRLPKLEEKDIKRLKKYWLSWRYLSGLIGSFDNYKKQVESI